MTYVAPDVQTHQVHVISSRDSSGFPLTVGETGADTGSFQASFNTGPATMMVLDLSGGGDESTVGIDLDGNGLLTSTGVTTTNEILCDCDLDGDGKATSPQFVQEIDLRLATGFPIRPTIAPSYRAARSRSSTTTPVLCAPLRRR